MPEGKGVNVNIDFKDVWSAVHDVGDWVASEATTKLVDNAFMIPKGVSSPNELSGWEGEPHHIWQSYEWEGHTSDTRIHYGIVWYYGASVEGRGRYIGNADIYFAVDEIGFLEKFRVDASFNNPMTIGNGVAQMSGGLSIGYYEYGSLSKSLQYQFIIRGDGAGNLWRT